MAKNHHNDIFTIGIGGAAGDGVREAGFSLGQLLCELGYEVFISFNYPSLIRGGHNFTRISFSKDKVWSDHKKLDVLIALNEESVKLHIDELHKAKDHVPGIVFADSFDEEDKKVLGEQAIPLPMMEKAKELNAPMITRNSMALGATCYLVDLNYELMQKILADVFKNKSADLNIKLADIGFDILKGLGTRHMKKLEPGTQKKELIDGNTAVAKGFMAAGLDFYVGYPMTPATGDLHYLAAQQAKSNIKVIQPESELSVINMALGMSYAGKRVAVGSATGGFMLMQEAFSFSGIAELPLAVVVAQRQGPATGVPTYSSQTDLNMAIHAGHGEFPRIVLIPGDTDEAFEAGANALNLAWKYQIPAIVLMDKILCEHASTASLKAQDITIDQGLIAKNPASDYGRYEITKDGISPIVFPGTSNAVVKITSYEHDEHGVTTEEAEMMEKMIDKRFKKGETLQKELKHFETVKIYGDKDSDTAIIFWGSTKGPVLEAAKYLDKTVKLIQILWAEPFDSHRLKNELKGVKNIINIECNHNAQMAALIREKTGIEMNHNILKYDARPFDPIELVGEINTILK